MRVWIIKTGENIPFEGETVRPMRAGLLSKMLVENGHEVTWWVSSVNHFTKTIYPQSSETNLTLPCGTKLIFLKSILYTKNISLRRFINHFGIASQFKKMACQLPKPDIVICCFPTIELSYNAVNFCKKNNIPILIDIRDLYPDVYINLFPSVLRIFAKLLFFPMTWMTTKTMKEATGLTAISNTYLKWGLGFANRTQHKYDGVFPLSYPQNDENTLPDTEFVNRLKKLKNKKIALYVGSFVSSIDLETVIQAARLLQERKIDDYHFVLCGDGKYKDQWETLAKGLHNVTFMGWVNSQQIAWLARRSWVGLGAYKKDALMSFPNKIFEYMSFGLPILFSLKGETQCFLEENDCGLYYESGNPESLINHLQYLNASPDRRDHMGLAGLQLYKEKYSPPLVYGNMIKLATQIVENFQSPHLAEG
ncbi:MAG: glycosyltransferase family 4 protein [Alphaproteobacteria bacterium]|nr:glycosyltransferase family 4 protein [Alphaproteobacteria bacterium]